MAGASVYWLFAVLPLPEWVGEAGLRCVKVVQPMLIFMMLFVTFCKIDVGELHLRRWHAWLLLFQCAMFMLTAWVATIVPHGYDVVVEGAMLCLVCPTATAAAVVTQKLGGSAGRITSYTILVNFLAAVMFSAVVPLIHPQPGLDFCRAFALIVSKVFPLLFMPVVAAVLARRFVPSLPRFFKRFPDLAFNLWIVALALAIGVTVRSIVHSHYPVASQAGIAVSSAVACAVQFAFGRWIGGFDRDAVTAGQALGQKNTVVAIWMGYTFLDPVTSIAGGFYSVWHNVFNSWQLYRQRRRDGLAA